MQDSPDSDVREAGHKLKRQAYLLLSGLGLFLLLEGVIESGPATILWLVFGALYIESVVGLVEVRRKDGAH